MDDENETLLRDIKKHSVVVNNPIDASRKIIIESDDAFKRADFKETEQSRPG